MKRMLLTLAVIAIAQVSHAQWTTSGSNIYNTNSGNVGIGTTAPAVNLEVYDNSGTAAVVRVNAVGSNAGQASLKLLAGYGSTTRASRIDFINSVSSLTVPRWTEINDYNQDGTNTLDFVNSSNTRVATILQSGNVGIGTTSPTRRLDILSGSGVTPLAVVGPAGYMLIDNTGAGYNYYQANILHQFQGTSNNPIMTLYANGNVGIGTTDPQGYMLAVNGSAIATSVTVKLHGSWPDYVFKPKYNLLSLAQVKTYIDQNKHLPDMPSEQEVAKNGINLGEMNKVLTKKVEELTLYAIDQQKHIDELEKLRTKTEQQEARIAVLDAALSKLTASK